MQEIIQFINNNLILHLIWITLLSVVIFIIFKKFCFKINYINTSKAIYLINKENAIIIDLRDKNEYCNGHILSSINITLKNIQNGILGELDKEKNKPIIVTCAYGTVSCNAARNLNKLNFKIVYVLKNGISGWSRDHLPLFQSK